jgi:Xaa-Pro dipeptidase
MDAPGAVEGRAARRGRLRELMERRGVAALLLRRPANFAWYTGGADSRVDHLAPEGVADLLLTVDRELVVTNSIEAPRMRAEQTPDLELVEYPWYEGPSATLRELTGDGVVGADIPLESAADLGEEVARLRQVLDPDAIARLRSVGADATAAIDEAAASVAPGAGERDVAAALAAACLARGLSAPVLLVGADERIARFRHPLPSGALIERRALLAVSAERGGLYANLTRTVELEPAGAEIERRLAACAEILGRMREEASRPGRTLAEAFEDCRRFYADAGFPEEWRLHHQGGITGYASREVIATPATDDQIEVGMAFAWNPSITGAKAEETFILTETGAQTVAGAAIAAGRS